ncbi:MAG: 16S rRNA (adenine(1518)-N(6)/adenine(1519)-N(6))-dimethyltransferase RsmA [Candidatus Omnitrophota bacterium]
MKPPLKRFGQNFLIDKNIVLKILNVVGVSKKDAVLEIGPGRGALTFEMARHAGKFCAVEVDRDLTRELAKSLSIFDNAEIVLSDILEFDLAEYALKKGIKKFRVVGNLPYYITTPILEYLFKNIQYVEDIFITVQKEVADRMTACAGSKDYGSLSCFVSYYSCPRVLFKIKKGSFWPVPKVESAFVHLKANGPKKNELGIKSESMFFDCMRRSFGQRRKRLLGSLSALVKKEDLSRLPCVELLKKRPEELTLKDFAKVSNQIFDFLGQR